MIIGLVAFLVSFLSGSLGVLNVIGSGFVFTTINTLIKLTNGQDYQWRIHLANFFISLIYLIFNLSKIFRNIYYLFGTLIIVVISWGFGKVLLNHFSVTNFKIFFLLGMIILASLNVKKSENIVVANDVLSDVSIFNSNDFFIISFCSFLSSYLEVNFGAISCLVLITIKKKIKMIDLTNIVYFSMLFYSILNFTWYSIKKEVHFDTELEIYLFLGLIFGAIFSMSFRNNCS